MQNFNEKNTKYFSIFFCGFIGIEPTQEYREKLIGFRTGDNFGSESQDRGEGSETKRFLARRHGFI